MRVEKTKVEKRLQRAKNRVGENSSDPGELPYRPSWVDDLISWIRRMPIPSWLVYMGLFSILTLFIQIGYFIDGYSLFSRYDTPLLYRIMAIYPVTFLAAIHYLDNTACRSFDDFRPTLGLSENETSRLRYELTTIPSRQGWVAAVIGVLFGLFVIFISDYKPVAEKTPSAFGIGMVMAILGFVMTVEMLYHTVRQLRLVSHIHGIATDVNLLDAAPLYAFSRLSAQTGLFFILNMYFDVVANSETLRNPGLLVLNFLVLPLIAVACFILPIEGMHRRLVLEKRRLQKDVNQRLGASMELLYQQVDSANLQDADALNKTISSLVTTRELIAKIPTWPWQPETSALFLSALSLPIIVFLIQMLLKNLFGF